MGDTRTNKKFEPFLAHSELTDCIYIIDEDANKYEVTKQCIKAMEATNRLPKWIPVTERLPKTRDEVLIFLANGQITIASYNDHFLPFFNKPIGWGVDAKRFVFDFCSDDVIAWMPLPEPYKAESEKDVCKDCYYNDGEVHAECVMCDKAESEEGMNCEDCLYSDIADWEQNEKTGKAKAVYWCERHKKMCNDIQECQIEDGNEKVRCRNDRYRAKGKTTGTR